MPNFSLMPDRCEATRKPHSPGIDEIYARLAGPAVNGSRPQPPGSGGLRDKVLGRLGDRPSASMTQREIHRVLSHSFVTIASALDTSVKLSDAGVTVEKPVSSASSPPAAESAQVGGAGETRDCPVLRGSPPR